MTNPRQSARPPRGTPGFVRVWAARSVALGQFVDGYQLLVMGPALLFLGPDLGLSIARAGLLYAIGFVGVAVGLSVVGDLSARLGRRVLPVGGLALLVFTSVAAALAQNQWQLSAARLLIGVAVGADIRTAHCFVTEIAPGVRRGRVGGSPPVLMWLSGAVFAVLLAMLLAPLAGHETWRWLFGAGALPAAAALMVRHLLPESPRGLLARGKYRTAVDVATRLGLAPPGEATTGPADRRRGGTPPRRSAATAALLALQSFGGAVTTSAAPLVLTVGLDTPTTLAFSLAALLAGGLGVIGGSLVADRVDRRAMIVWTCLGVFLAALGVATVGRQSAGVLALYFTLYSFLSWLGPGALSRAWVVEAAGVTGATGAHRSRGSSGSSRADQVAGALVRCVARLAGALNLVLIPPLLPRFGLTTVLFCAWAYLVYAGIVIVMPWSVGVDRHPARTTRPDRGGPPAR